MTAKEAWNGLLDDIKTMKHLTNLRQRKEILDKLDILRLALLDYEELKQEVIARQETENSLTQWVADLTTELEELKRDVKRYFELEGNYQKSSHEYHEMEYIKNKLMEVGAKDE